MSVATLFDCQELRLGDSLENRVWMELKSTFPGVLESRRMGTRAVAACLCEGRAMELDLLLQGNVQMQLGSLRAAFILACARGHVKCVELVMAAGLRPTCRWHWKRTGLHVAAFHGHKDLVNVLVAYGADLNARDKYGATPLHKAFESLHGASWETVGNIMDCIDALHFHGADATIRDDRGFTPEECV